MKNWLKLFSILIILRIVMNYYALGGGYEMFVMALGALIFDVVLGFPIYYFAWRKEK